MVFPQGQVKDRLDPGGIVVIFIDGSVIIDLVILGRTWSTTIIIGIIPIGSRIIIGLDDVQNICSKRNLRVVIERAGINIRGQIKGNGDHDRFTGRQAAGIKLFAGIK
jgi:hypothetical protein